MKSVSRHPCDDCLENWVIPSSQAQLEQERLQLAEEKRANEAANRLRLACIFVLIIYLFLDISLKYLFLTIYSEVGIRKRCIKDCYESLINWLNKRRKVLNKSVKLKELCERLSC